MDCLDPPLLEIPQGNWYCDECFSSSDESDEEDDEEEVDDLINDAEDVIGELPESRLRTRQQPQILRTSQSERIRNAIVARMSLRGAREALGEGPSTSSAVVTRRPVRRRRTTRRRATRRRTKTVVVEYDVDGSDKFAMRKKRVPVRRRKGRRKKRKVARRKPARTSKATAGASTSFKGVNSNVHDLQRGRQLAGLSNFNIFEPTNMLDYVPDEDNIDDSGIEIGGGNVLTQAIIGLNNPQRRNMMIKNRVLQNCTTTSSSVDLLGSIMQDQDMFGPGSITKRFAVEKSSGKLVFKGEGVKKASDGNGSSGNSDEPKSETTSPPENSPRDETPVGNSDPTQQDNNKSSDDPEESQNLPAETFEHDKKKKPKKPEIDMFDENPAEPTTDDCPIFSIYDSVNVMVDQENSSSFQNRQAYDEENVDLVQMSDAEEAPPAIVASQPASPDVEADQVGERSYTPPIALKTSDDAPDRDDEDSEKRKKDQRKNRKRESSVKRYSVRDRLKDRSPGRLKDKFGRNRSRSSSRKKQSRRRSGSRSYRRSRSPEKLRRSPSRSRSRRRTPSIEYDRKKRNNKKKSGRRSRSRSLTPRLHRATTPERKNRSKSKKAKKKKHRDYSKEKPSTLTKEVFTSGQNILVSVNFNNQDEKLVEDREPKEIVDITARKKITVSSKPVAIIDLARSPFRELTPEYQTNVIELSDSDGERSNEKNPPKSPDSSSKLYDPFDILNSPTNENVTSSQNAAAVNSAKLAEKNSEPTKINASYNKNVMAMATGANLFSTFEENLVSSSSQPQLIGVKIVEKNASKNEVVPMDIAESPYSPGHDYDDSFQHDDGDGGGAGRGSKTANIFEDLFGSTTPPGLDKFKNSGKKSKQKFEGF